jgi:hypothetical protein
VSEAKYPSCDLIPCLVATGSYIYAFSCEYPFSLYLSQSTDFRTSRSPTLPRPPPVFTVHFTPPVSYKPWHTTLTSSLIPLACILRVNRLCDLQVMAFKPFHLPVIYHHHLVGETQVPIRDSQPTCLPVVSIQPRTSLENRHLKPVEIPTPTPRRLLPVQAGRVLEVRDTAVMIRNVKSFKKPMVSYVFHIVRQVMHQWSIVRDYGRFR